MRDERDGEAVNPARSFYLRREFRGSALWGICGCLAAIVLIGTSWSLGYPPRQGDPGGNVLSLAAFAAITLWLTQYVLPRVRLDEQGIRRRFLWWWAAPWPWEAFRSGRVHEEGGRHCYRFEDRSWWRGGRMHFFSLEWEDAESIRDRLEREGMTFPQPPVPEELNLKLDWPDSREVRLHRCGIVVRNKKTESSYEWSDVDRVEIWRMMAGWREFVELEMFFDDQSLSFKRPARMEPKPEYDRWRGASSAMISAMVRHYVDPARIQDYAIQGQPRSPEEREARHAREAARIERQLGEQKFIVYLMWFFAATSILVLPWMDTWSQGIAIVVLLLVVALGIHGIYRSDRKKLDRLRKSDSISDRFPPPNLRD